MEIFAKCGLLSGAFAFFLPQSYPDQSIRLISHKQRNVQHTWHTPAR